MTRMLFKVLFFPYYFGLVPFVITVACVVSLWHLSLLPLKSFTSGTKCKNKTRRQTLVVLGSGWASYYTVLGLKEHYKIVLVSPRDHFLFTPFLCSTSVGTLGVLSAMESVCSFAGDCQFILGEATKVDFANQNVSVRRQYFNDEIILDYDKLVVGVGATTRSFGVDGVKEHAVFMKEAVDAEIVRRKLITNFELALCSEIDLALRQELVNIVIVGGGPTGVELAGELSDFFSQDLYKFEAKENIDLKITIIERSKLLASFQPKLQQYVESVFTKRACIEVVRGTVTGVLENGVVLQDGSFIPSRLIVWTVGITQREFTQKLNVSKSSSGAILVNKHLSLVDEGVNPGTAFAIGDCCQIIDNPLASTAQVARCQGEYLAKLLNYVSQNNFHNDIKNFPSFTFKNAGMLAYLGDYKGVAELNILSTSICVTGFPAFFIWRSVYLSFLETWRRRVQVPYEWLKTFIFGRNVTSV